jgi:hypothetical protein
MKWSGAFRLEMELMLVETHTEVRNMRKKVREFRKETENK